MSDQQEGATATAAADHGAREASARSERKRIAGVVVGNKMSKTITVRSDHRVKHPKYGKYIKRHTMYKVHDENEAAAVGDLVEIVGARPLSKTKHWRLSRIVKSRSQEASSGE